MHAKRLMQPTGRSTAQGGPPEVRTIADLLGMICGAADACDLAVTSVSHRGLRVLLPDGPVRIELKYGATVPLHDDEDADPMPSDQYPAIPAWMAEAEGCGTLPIAGWGD